MREVLDQMQAVLFGSGDPQHARRRHPRIPVDFKVRCQAEEGDAIEAQVADLASGGLKLVLPAKLKREQRLQVHPLPGGSGVRCRVAWTKEVWDGYSVGLIFEDSDENIATSWIQLTLRRALGNGVTAEVPIEVHDAPGEFLSRGYFLDVSLEVARLRLDRKLADNLSLRMRVAPRGAAILLLGQVVEPPTPAGETGWNHRVQLFPAHGQRGERLHSLLLALLESLRRGERLSLAQPATTASPLAGFAELFDPGNPMRVGLAAPIAPPPKPRRPGLIAPQEGGKPVLPPRPKPPRPQPVVEVQLNPLDEVEPWRGWLSTHLERPPLLTPGPDEAQPDDLLWLFRLLVGPRARPPSPQKTLHQMMALQGLGGSRAMRGLLRSAALARSLAAWKGASEVDLAEVYAVALVRDLGEAAWLAQRQPKAYRAGLGTFLAPLSVPASGDPTDLKALSVPGPLFFSGGQLNSEGQIILRGHPELGAALVGCQPVLAVLSPAVRAHHERWDGLGYPDGLKAEEIPLASRCVAIADTFAALAGRGLNLEEASRFIEAGRGNYFDPELVDGFLSLVLQG